jgi:hypothetical protein
VHRDFITHYDTYQSIAPPYISEIHGPYISELMKKYVTIFLKNNKTYKSACETKELYITMVMTDFSSMFEDYLDKDLSSHKLTAMVQSRFNEHTMRIKV